MKVLLVEDSKTQRQVIQKIISELGEAEILHAGDAFEAYAKLRVNNDTDLIVLDYNMPYATGLQFLEKVKATDDFKNIPVLISSTEHDEDTFKKAGAASCLKKPYTPGDLKREIENLIQN